MENNPAELTIIDLGLMGFEECFEIQQSMVRDRIADNLPDHLLLVTHPHVLTIGKSGSSDDLYHSKEALHEKGVQVCLADRGGKSTYHGPGQLVAYPIIKLNNKDVHLYVEKLLDVISSVLVDYGLQPELRVGTPGVWVNNGKISSIGISMKKWVAYHGIAINVNTDISFFELINPCGVPGQLITSMKNELVKEQDLNSVKNSFVDHFKKVFGYCKVEKNRHPEWLRISSGKPAEIDKVTTLIQSLNLETVCQSAKCPNLSECYSKGTATFMILGRYCTRNCRFCAVEHGVPLPQDIEEPGRVALAVNIMKLDYVVITSVTRDDLQDGGAGQFVQTINRIRELCPETRVEVLVPDFRGSKTSIAAVCQAGPDIFNHNLETVLRLSSLVRPQADYHRSLYVLKQAVNHGLSVKSGLMLGLGESRDEVIEALHDLLDAGCANLTIGQYLAPSKEHFPVARYISPDEFDEWANIATTMGFKYVVASPLVRSSYNAAQFFNKQS